jgi:7-carboxy-7-deazaguanine synthase
MTSIAHRTVLLQTLGPGELFIHEIYKSLQGESTFVGRPCTFIRTAQCDYRCTWCDTPHAFTQGEPMSRTTVLAKALSFDTPIVEITGGEPLLQSEVLPLMSELADAGKTVLLETHGGLDVGPVDRRVHIIMDLKCPDSGECERNDFANLAKLKPSDEIKFVIASRRDWDWALSTIIEHRLDERFTVLVSGVFNELKPADLAAWLLASGHDLRFQLQLHKLIWDPKARGV